MLSVMENVPMAQACSFTTPLPQLVRLELSSPSPAWIQRLPVPSGHTQRRTRIQTLHGPLLSTLDAFCTPDCLVPLETESPRTDCASWDHEGTHVGVGFWKQAPFLHTAEEGIQL